MRRASGKRMLQRKTDRQEQEQQAEICRQAMERERQPRSREEQLLGKKELPGVLQCLAVFYEAERSRKVSKLDEVPVVPPQLETEERPPKSKYNRYDQEKFLKGQQEFGINPQGSHLENVKSEFVRLNRQGSHIEKTMPTSFSPKIAKTAEKVERRLKIVHYHARMPIIVVPQALTSLITLHNARQLLQEMRYVSVEHARQSYRPSRPPQFSDEVIIQRRFQDELVSYRIIDVVTRLTSEEWVRVAAVFALGPNWQFKGWPLGTSLADIFQQVCAFHLYFKDSPPCKELQNLPVNMLALSLNERHSDCGILTEFWNKLDLHMAVRHRQFAFVKQK
ncbi:parafibromin [Drosophila gunungcola]|uniref:Cell division control protein 73 C-terminal domain-containing protein n=1 Tax=Drosophila gunungcola TaxID=103775 RepID=A0A9P9YIE6_9MUSC|nr:parafibromin [Drosophila gunungcola]KAI8037555.1 hypothetical protein M5D96_009708 [Drosophila gunungcola]